MEGLINGSVYYKIFDKTFNNSSHRYIKKNNSISATEIVENKKSIITYFKAQDILILNQVHGNQIVNADDSIIAVPEADGSIATKKNLVLAVQSADCVPVLLASGNGKIIGAAHAGWKGSINIISNIVTKMTEKGAKNLIAVIGPAIVQSSYEVDGEYYKAFLSKDINNKQFFINSKRENHYMFDLPAFVELKLKEAGVKNIKNIGEDTYTNPLKYPSRRRSLHLQEPYNENILSTIVIK
ncbi:MAG: peptidoglycan editing factor PgeF [Rickettsia endosymbiont of Ixodes persulcatus]|nr:peptidoglycan editing factor PgeF [Rickettsia endosymbiont of Ixodes persulcatus]MCZ6902807.1 peptidoglycan editing factor PgeF [Rickettsia endosymbiont of Ixodes persulcatus]MCZ6908804.1 peptidoglycan editing factor PgeF [Rickettsia endosymbiont of Ixodes persulcatus]MCZ6910208.1 peptidoglycan editing factor PgeF [Rickettsia endosymbiont of Ixodes persulcatus]MCZ6914984.1 peptidoglycan editing factor PgeF [Rickettsia endosymbiont of Ixodes persulcatus]